MRMLECLLIENNCYKKYHASEIIPTGIVVHSTDKAGGVLKRFVQPTPGQTFGLKDGDKAVTADQMIGILGKNINGNSWNRSGATACVHAFIGKTADGSYAVCKTLEYTQPCWGGAFGAKGSYDGRVVVNNNKIAGGHLYIQFEMIEDASGDPVHCKKLYELAVEFCAYLCKLFPTIAIEDIVSHKDACARGYASNHGDPESYWKKCGTNYTMSGFREAVKHKMQKKEEIAVTEEQLEQFIDSIIDKRFPGLWDQAYQRKMESLNDNDSASWSAEAREWAVENGIVNGVGENPDGTTNYAWEQPLTREQYVTTEYRQHLNEIGSEEGDGDA